MIVRYPGLIFIGAGVEKAILLRGLTGQGPNVGRPRAQPIVNWDREATMSVLDQSALEHFRTFGRVRVREAFPAADAGAMCSVIRMCGICARRATLGSGLLAFSSRSKSSVQQPYWQSGSAD